MLPWCHGLRSILDFHWSFPVDGAGIGRREGSFGVRTSGGARRSRRGYSPHHIAFVLRLQFSSRHTILSPLRPPAVQGLHGDAPVSRERGATEATTMIEGTTFEGAWELLAKWCPAQAYQTNRRHEVRWITLKAATPKG